MDGVAMTYEQPRAEVAEAESGEETPLVVVPLRGAALGFHETPTHHLALTADEARDLAIKLMAVAGPNTDELVRTWVAGQVRVTAEAPKAAEAACVARLALHPAADEFENVIESLGGMAAFEDFEPTRNVIQCMYATVPCLDPAAPRMNVAVEVPRSLYADDAAPPLPTRLTALVDRQREMKDRRAEEQAAADRLASEQPRQSIEADPLAPGPGKDGH